VLRTWRDLSQEAPRQATFTASLAGDQDVVTVGFVWVGHPATGRQLPSMKPLGKPLTERVVELSYVDLQRIDDTPQGHALRRYMKGHYLGELSDDAIEAMLESRTDRSTVALPNVGLQAYGGAIAEVPDQDTAFTFRNTAFEYVAASRWTDPAEDDQQMALARRTAAALDPFARGQYVNTLSDEGAEGVRRVYPPDKLARLTALKDKYDRETSSISTTTSVPQTTRPASPESTRPHGSAPRDAGVIQARSSRKRTVVATRLASVSTMSSTVRLAPGARRCTPAMASVVRLSAIPKAARPPRWSRGATPLR